jgi:2,4-dienoyl-CoA reductase-like NADH-dependent reductase (Old Yellow Enzyme family)
MPGVAGLFHEKHIEGWKKVVTAVHEKGGVIYAQLWHSGRANIPQMTGYPTVSASATPWGTDEKFPYPIPGTKQKVFYKDVPPIELSEEHMKKTIQDFITAAQLALEIGFDGVEIQGSSGYREFQF